MRVLALYNGITIYRSLCNFCVCVIAVNSVNWLTTPVMTEFF